MIFIAQVAGSMTDPINMIVPALAAIFIRRFGYVAAACLIWSALVQLFVAHMAAKQQIAVNHGAIFMARLVGSLILAGAVWGIAFAIRKRSSG